jgi:DNA (cytosine-5)-methyltransferase 1
LAGLRKGFADGKGKKGAMVLYIYKLLIAKNPQFFVLENVKGILNHDGGKTYRKVFDLFENAGYYVRCVLLNSLYYGSAQNRERVLFLGSKTPFDAVRPEIMDDSKRFIDVFDPIGPYKELKRTKRNEDKVEQLLQFKFEVISKYDRVGTLLTTFGCGEKVVVHGDWVRHLTPLECERLQCFPEGWTASGSDNSRYFALGNAVNCKVSEYLFTTYLPKVWKMV